MPSVAVVLQRGRACEGAEMVPSSCSGVRACQLQRGRACEGAEMTGVEADVCESIRLQRGRACEGAEIPTLAIRHFSGSNGFNGAAPVRARKYQLVGRWMSL